MTIIAIGLSVENAFGWASADSEGFQLEPDGHISGSTGHSWKLAVNKSTNVAAVGAGDAGGNKSIADAVAFADSFDDLCFGLPRLLCVEAKDRVDAHLDWPDWVCAAVGFSRRFRRITGVVFEAKMEFVPRYVSTGFSLPRVPLQDLANVTGSLDVLPIAQMQMQSLRRDVEIAGAGTLTIAMVRRDGVSVSAFDIPGGYGLPTIPELKPMGALS